MSSTSDGTGSILDTTGSPEPGASAPCRTILGEAFTSLHPHVRRAHEVPLTAEGTFEVEHGTHWLAPLMIRLLRLPAAGRAQRVRLDVAPAGAGAEWVRRIGSSVLRTRQDALGSLLVERQGAGSVTYALDVKGDALVYRQVSMRAGGIVIPPSVHPRVDARVTPAVDGWRVEVTVTWRTHLICRYAGALRPS